MFWGCFGLQGGAGVAGRRRGRALETHSAQKEASALIGCFLRDLELMPNVPLPPPPARQDVDPAKPANPLYETNQSQLSAPDDTVYAEAGRPGAPASIPNSMMSTRSRQVRRS